MVPFVSFGTRSVAVEEKPTVEPSGEMSGNMLLPEPVVTAWIAPVAESQR